MAPNDLSMPEAVPIVSEEPQPSAASSGAVEQQMPEELASLVAEVTALRQTIEERLSYDRVKEEAFDRLYAEVEEVRQERAFQLVRPLLIDLLLLFDRIKLCREDVSRQASTAFDVAQMLQTISDELLEVLYRREVEVIVAESPTFNRALQQVVGSRPTTSAAQHNQVVRVVRQGFRHRNRILRPEEVIVKSYTPIDGGQV